MNPVETSPENNDSRPDHWTLIRDAAVLQGKLLFDGLRDIILMPASLIAAIVSLARTENGKPGPEFYTLIDVGRQSERWINLFGAMQNAPPDIARDKHFGDADIDAIVSRVETFVIDEYKKGGITAQAKERIDKALEAMQRRRSKKP